MRSAGISRSLLHRSNTLSSFLRLWDAGTGAQLQTLEGHWGGIISVAVSPNGKLVASSWGSDNEPVWLWGAGTGARLQTLEGHESGVSSVVFSPDSKVVASGSGDH